MEQDKDEAASRTPFPMESIPESSSSVISSPSASLDSPFSSRSPLDSPSSKQSTSPLEVVSSPEAEREDTRLSMEEHLEKKMRFRRPRTPSVEHPSLMESERGKKSAWNPFFQDSTYHTPSWGPMAMGSVIKGVIMECLIKGYEGVFLFVTTMELILAFHVLTTNPVFGTETRDMMTKETCGILTSYVIVFYILMTLLARTSMRAWLLLITTFVLCLPRWYIDWVVYSWAQRHPLELPSQITIGVPHWVNLLSFQMSPVLFFWGSILSRATMCAFFVILEFVRWKGE
mmetsp:Transcript_39680/g.102010  ORF Transcript_39680/g.102010 Transcript_39680/m.102010 type:complete len:287 (-) Transcript_39680:104-964(-)